MANSPKFTGTFLTEMRKGGEIGWVPFKTEVVEYASQDAMDGVKHGLAVVWGEKYKFSAVVSEGNKVFATVSPVARLTATFEAK